MRRWGCRRACSFWGKFILEPKYRGVSKMESAACLTSHPSQQPHHAPLTVCPISHIPIPHPRLTSDNPFTMPEPEPPVPTAFATCCSPTPPRPGNGQHTATATVEKRIGATDAVQHHWRVHERRAAGQVRGLGWGAEGGRGCGSRAGEGACCCCWLPRPVETCV